MGNLVMEIQLNTQKAVQEANNVNQQLKILKSGYKDLTQAERELGKSEESFKARGKLLKEESKILGERSTQARKEFEEFKQQNADKNTYTQAQIATYNKLNRAVLDADTKYNSSLSKKQMNEESFSNYKKGQIESISKLETDAINKQKKLEDELQAKRKKNIEEALNAAEKGSEAIMKAITVASATGGVAMKSYMEHEASMLDVTRVARGTDEQNTILEDQIQEFIWSRPEDNDALLAAAEVIVKAVDPANYGEINTYLEDIANASLASNKALDEIAKESMGLVEKGVLSIDDLDNYYSAMNETQNRYGTDMGMQSQILNSVGSQAINNNISIPDMIALAGYVSKVTSRGAEASSSSIVELTNLFGSASFNTSGAEYVLKHYGGSFDQLYRAQAWNTEKYKELVDMTGLKTEDLNKQLDTLAFRSDVANYTGRTESEVVEMVRNKETGTLFAEFFEGMRKQAEREDILLSELTASKGYFKNNIRLQEMIADLSSADDGVLTDYMATANQAFTEGTSVDEEAEAILELTLNRFKVWMGKFKEMWVDFGAVIAPGIMDFLEEDVTPWLDFVHNLIKQFGELDLDSQRETVQGIVKWMAGIFLAAGSIRGVVGAYRGFTAIKGGIGALSGLLGMSKVTGAIAKEGAVAVGSLGKLKLGIASLASPVGLVVGGLGLLAGGLYALHQYQERQAEEGIYRQDGGYLSDEQKGRINEDVGGTRSARAKTQVNMGYSIELTYSEGELQGLSKGVENQVEEIKEQLDKTAGEFQFTLTGDAELDAKMSERAQTERDEAATKKKEADKLQQDLLTLYTDAIESGGELTHKQIAEIQKLQKELDLMYAKYSGGDEESSRGVYASLQNQGGYAVLSNSEAEELSKGLSEELSRTEVELRRKLDLTDSMLADGEITRSQAELQRAKDLEYFEGQKSRILAEAAAIRVSRNTWDGIWYDDSFKGVEGYNKSDGKGMGKLTDMQNIGAELIVDTGDRETAMAWVEFIESTKDNKESLDSFMDLGTSSLFNSYVAKEGTESLLELQGVITNLIPTESSEELSAYIDLLVKAKGEAGTLTDTEFKMYVENNLVESVGEAIEVGKLWEDLDFRNKLLSIDIDSYDSNYQVSELLATYDTIPESLVTNVRTDGVSVALQNISMVRNQALALDGTQATVRINTIGNTQITNKTAMTEQTRARLREMGVKLATGTDSHSGGLAWLGDGGRHEPYLTPDGSFGISPNDWTLYDLPKQTKVWSSVDNFMRDLPKFSMGTGNSWLDSKLRTSKGSTTSNESNISYNISVGSNAGVTKGEVERIVRKVHDERDRRERTIASQSGVV